MSAISDMLAVPVLVLGSIFSSLDSVYIDSWSLLDVVLAFMYLAVTLTFIFALFDVEIDFWGHIFEFFGDLEEDDD